MTLNIPLSPDAVEKLRERAEAEGKDIETFVRDVLAEKLASAQAGPGEEAQSAEQWSAMWREWAASHPKLEHFVDDSRESIYAGRGE